MTQEIGTLSIGTYDGILYCFKVYKESSEDSSPLYSLKLIFNVQPHSGSIRSLAGSNRYLASGGFDGTIAVFDLHTKKNAGSLVLHEDCVEAIQFYQDSYLISGSSDKTIAIWRTSDWSLMKQMKGHTGGVTALSINPTGKFMISAGKDGVLRMWDLMHAHNAKTRKIDVIAPFIGFTEDARQFYFGHDHDVSLVDGPSEALVFNFDHQKTVTASCLYKGVLWVGTSDGTIVARNISTGELIGEYPISENRIKFISVSNDLIFILTSDGTLKVGIVSSDFEIDEIINKNLNTRITCGEFIPSSSN